MLNERYQSHPLSSGGAPVWATAWGEDEYGPFALFEVGGIEQRLRWIRYGSFVMGSPDGEGRENEHPQHQVTISRGFWLFETPCTQALWQAVMNENPSHFKDSPNHPVEQVSWNDCQDFFKKLTSKVSGLYLTLPSEAEWEWSCRAGSSSSDYGKDLGLKLADIAWYAENSRKQTQPVGQKRSNTWGLHDMLGNVWEWCADGLRDYTEEALINPRGPEDKDTYSSLRGGGWYDSAEYVRAARRFDWDDRDDRSDDIGFRPRVQ